MTTQAKYLRRDPAQIAPWAETCGQIRFLIDHKDAAAGEVCEVEIADAKLHYHERTDEFYYVIDGEGRMRLDDDEVELHRGVVVYVPRGVKHKAWGQLKALIVASLVVCSMTSMNWSERKEGHGVNNSQNDHLGHVGGGRYAGSG